MNIAELLEDRRVCVCAGSGGVGKTTAAATIALGMAARGKRVAVVTIDPARRLANALGLEQLDNEPRRVDPALLAPLELDGELWAMMLDPKRTFDELIDRAAPSAERAAEIKANRVYRELSTAVSGSQEFTAVSKLYELVQERDFDLLVLDTPPARNALDFLDAPRRLTSFLEGRMLKAFLRPTGIGMRLIGIGAAPVLAAVRRVTGIDLVGELMTFFTLLGDMTESFTARARHVEELLRSPQTAFLLITSAQGEPIDEAIWFRRTLNEAGLPFSGVVVNRFHHDAGAAGPAELAELLEASLGGPVAAQVAETVSDYRVLAERDAANVARLETHLEGEPVLLVPQFDGDVHDVAGLLLMHRYLFGSDAERALLIEDLVS